jgi:hypothetical protein
MRHTLTTIYHTTSGPSGIEKWPQASGVPPALGSTLARVPRLESLGYYHGVPPGPGTQSDDSENCGPRARCRTLDQPKPALCG